MLGGGEPPDSIQAGSAPWRGTSRLTDTVLVASKLYRSEKVLMRGAMLLRVPMVDSDVRCPPEQWIEIAL